MKKKIEYDDINTLIDAIKLAKSSKYVEYEQVGHIAVQSLKALENLNKKATEKKGACPAKDSMQ